MIARLTPDAYRRMPWKNGDGMTTEIARAETGDGNFLWRLSIADVVRDGPFSRFPDHERLIAVVEGAGMALSVGGGPAVSLGLLDGALRFDGAAETQCRLLDGPIRDLNLMVDRRHGSGGLHILRDGARWPAEGTTVLVHVLSGTAAVTTGAETARLAAAETAVLTEAPAVVVQAGPQAAVAVAEVRRRPA